MTQYIIVCRALTTLALITAAPMGLRAQDAMPPEVRAEGRRQMAECEAHVHGERWAIAAECYEGMHRFMTEHSLPRAPMALLNVGRSLARIPGREADAQAVLQRFLDDSTALASGENATDVRERRSDAVALMAELDARLRRAGSDDEPSSERASEPLAERDAPVAWPGPALLAVGAATLLAGGILGGISLAENEALVAMCSDGLCPGELRADAEALHLRGIAADILIAAGAAVSVAGLILTMLLRDQPAEPVVSVLCGLESCGLAVDGAF